VTAVAGTTPIPTNRAKPTPGFEPETPSITSERFLQLRERDSRSLGYGGWYLPVYVKAHKKRAAPTGDTSARRRQPPRQSLSGPAPAVFSTANRHAPRRSR
jgi:hypothetical protein